MVYYNSFPLAAILFTLIFLVIVVLVIFLAKAIYIAIKMLQEASKWVRWKLECSKCAIDSWCCGWGGWRLLVWVGRGDGCWCGWGGVTAAGVGGEGWQLLVWVGRVDGCWCGWGGLTAAGVGGEGWRLLVWAGRVDFVVSLFCERKLIHVCTYLLTWWNCFLIWFLLQSYLGNALLPVLPSGDLVLPVCLCCLVPASCCVSSFRELIAVV